MPRLFFLICLVTGAFTVASFLGCGQSAKNIDPELVATHRTRLTLTEEPDGAQVVPEVRNALLGIEEEHDSHEHDHGDHDEHADHDDHDHEADQDHADHDDDESDQDEAEDDEDDGDEDGDDEDEADGDDGDEDEDDEDGDDDEDEEADDDTEHADHEDHADHEHEGEHAHEHADHEEHEHEEVVVVKATKPMNVVLVGQIGGLTNPWQETQPDFPFARNEASFFLSDPQSVAENEESGHVHADGEECAFCAAHAADRSSMLAMVRFLDEKGNVLPMDARQLFDVKEKDTVVVRGTARVIEGGMMVVEADGLYIRR
ncbi:MAG: hypothetical protein KDA57_07620 [Planctomycetales bacterium]|nr:hypothetical protein [Planctomycetales bacterium]